MCNFMVAKPREIYDDVAFYFYCTRKFLNFNSDVSMIAISLPFLPLLDRCLAAVKLQFWPVSNILVSLEYSSRA
jgi:hypothetical protein